MNSKIGLLVLLLSTVANAQTQAPDPWIGKDLPKVTLPSSKGGDLKLPTGRWTLLYFYPKDDTPGCTTQACSYRDNIQRFTSLGVDVYGVSADDLKSHDAFAGKHSLNFPLLSDVKHELTKPLGVKGMIFLSRDTFLINPEGKVVEVWRGVKPSETVSQTLETVKKHVLPTKKP